MELYKKIGLVVLGAAIYAIGQSSYQTMFSPDIVYNYQHNGNIKKFGSTVTSINGAKFLNTLADGRTDKHRLLQRPKTFDEMIQEALIKFKENKFLEQAGINPNQPISEIEIIVNK